MILTGMLAEHPLHRTSIIKSPLTEIFVGEIASADRRRGYRGKIKESQIKMAKIKKSFICNLIQYKINIK